jgi:hypothetical protein
MIETIELLEAEARLEKRIAKGHLVALIGTLDIVLADVDR